MNSINNLLIELWRITLSHLQYKDEVIIIVRSLELLPFTLNFKHKNVLICDRPYSSHNFSFSQTNCQFMSAGLNLLFLLWLPSHLFNSGLPKLLTPTVGTHNNNLSKHLVTALSGVVNFPYILKDSFNFAKEISEFID